MSLRIWLPLTKNLLNYGAADSSITASNVTANANGKIGGCYSFNGSSSSLIGTQSVISNNTDDWTFACWMKLNSTSNGQTLFCCRTAVNSTGIMVLWYGNSWLIDDGTRGQPSASISANTWYHVCVVRKKGVGKFVYVNGILTTSITTTGTQSSVSSTTYSIGGSQNTSTSANANWLNGYLNDVRFYDHALSVAEIKELSKGLSIHYKLNNSDAGDLNLVSLSNTGNTDRFGYSEQTGGSTKTVEYDGGIPCVKVTRNSTTHSGWCFLWHNGLATSSIKTSTTYTVSFDIIGSGNGSITFNGFMQTNATNSLSASNTVVQGSFNATTWSHIVLRTTTKSSFDGITVGTQVVYMGCSYMNNVNVWIKMKNFKVEEGTMDTNWSPYTTDPLYTALGYDSDVVIDSSGYDNNGIKTTGVTISSDTPRYDVCSVFNGSTGSVNVTSPIFPIILNSAFTISMWIYNDDARDRSILFGNYGLTGSFLNIEKKTNETVRFYWNNSPDITFSNSILTSGVFVHMAITRDGNTVKCYIDGILKDTSTTTLSGSIPANATEFRIGSDSRSGATLFKGRISDFRLYATALSADDVLALYNTGAKVADTGTMLGYMLKEG